MDSWKVSQSNTMHQYSTRHADRNKENIIAAKIQEPTGRITRARAKALGTSGGLPPLKALVKQEHKQVLQPNSKRASSDENRPTADIGAYIQPKRRVVLKDISNKSCDDSNVKCTNGIKVQNSKQTKGGTAKKYAKVGPAVFVDLHVQKDEAKTMEEMANQKINEPREISSPLNFENKLVIQPITHNKHEKLTFSKHVLRRSSSQKEEGKLCKKTEPSNGQPILDIDSKHKDPQMCSLYAADVYNNLRVTELNWRPSVDYMGTVQREITHEMRGILIDWLVEVCEEYNLAPDTLYLTVNLIDRFLSKTYIGKQRLQLLGITCMLIASKYEEICAPHVEEFCFITDSTYTRGEVLKMESQVLNVLNFQLSVPTTKKFLRRFVQAAQSFYEVSLVELEFLTNYLAELTLTEYSFLKFLPSLIAASAVFLARWTLDQAEDPWNPTLEHYTSYKATQLKVVVLALHDLQLNTNSSSLKAIREKYGQQKFKKVATLSSPKPVKPLS